MMRRVLLGAALLGISLPILATASPAACNPQCPTCQAAQAAVARQSAIIEGVTRPIIGPAYVCHDPNWASQYQPVGRWASLIESISQQVDGGYMPPLFTAAEMYNESRGNPDAIGAPVPNRALGLMQTLPPSEEQVAMAPFEDIHGYNGRTPTAWPRLPNHGTPLPSPQHSIRMGIQEQTACAKLFIGGLDPAAIPVCYSKSIALAKEVIDDHNNYQQALAGHPHTLNYVTSFLNFAHCTPVSPTASTPYRKYP